MGPGGRGPSRQRVVVAIAGHGTAGTASEPAARRGAPAADVRSCGVAVVRVVLLLVGSATALLPVRRVPGWILVLALGVGATAAGVVPWHVAREATGDLAPALAFLLVAVPLAIELDETGVFAALAARAGAGRHLLPALWILAAATTIVFNLDAAVVLLTPLYVRIAVGQGRDVVHLAVIPALLASLASSVLPVSNLTNLIAAERLDLSTGSFLTHLALPSALAIVVGGWLHLRAAPAPRPVRDHAEPIAPGALRVGIPVVVWLLAGFTVGDRWGVPAWVVAGVALAALVVHRRHVPWRHLPVGAAGLALGLGLLAAGAAPHLPVDDVLGIGGRGGTAVAALASAAAANAVNNLPALLVALPALDAHPDRVWAVLAGVNVGPTLWVTGALSTMLWQATMRRLGHEVSARTYARHGVRVGLPALALVIAVLALGA